MIKAGWDETEGLTVIVTADDRAFAIKLMLFVREEIAKRTALFQPPPKMVQ